MLNIQKEDYKYFIIAGLIVLLYYIFRGIIRSFARESNNSNTSVKKDSKFRFIVLPFIFGFFVEISRMIFKPKKRG